MAQDALALFSVPTIVRPQQLQVEDSSLYLPASDASHDAFNGLVILGF